MNQPNTPQEINKEVPPLSVADAPKDNLQSVLASEGKAMDVTTPKPTVAPDDKNQHDKSSCLPLIRSAQMEGKNNK